MQIGAHGRNISPSCPAFPDLARSRIIKTIKSKEILMMAIMKAGAYAPSMKALHWLIFFLVIGLYGLSYNEDLFPRGNPWRDTAWWLHISFGLLLFVLVPIQIALRLWHGSPKLPPAMSGLERNIAHLMHFLLYVLLITITVLGILLTWFRGDQLTFFGLLTVPSPFPADRGIAEFLEEAHGLAANIILVLASMHAAAALWHHFVRKDDVLKQMLPGADGRRTR